MYSACLRHPGLNENYPVAIAWSGVMVDEEGHVDDIVERIRGVARCIFGERANSIEEVACWSSPFVKCATTLGA